METRLKHDIYSIGSNTVNLHTFLGTSNSVCLNNLLTQPEVQHNWYENTVLSMLSQPHFFKILFNIIFHHSPTFHKHFAFTFSSVCAHTSLLCIINAQFITIFSEFKFTVIMLRMFRYVLLTYVYIPQAQSTIINRKVLIYSDLA
jgi:hypothetical protein